MAGALHDSVLGDGREDEDAVVEGCELLESAGKMGVGIVLKKKGLEIVLDGRRAAKQTDHRLDPRVRRRGRAAIRAIGCVSTIVIVWIIRVVVVVVVVGRVLVGLGKTQHGG